MRGTETASKRDSVFDAECCELPQPSNAFISHRSKNITCGTTEIYSSIGQRDSRFEIETERGTLGLQCFAPPTPSISPPA